MAGRISKLEKYKHGLESVDKIQGGMMLPIRLLLILPTYNVITDHAICSSHRQQFWTDAKTNNKSLEKDFPGIPVPRTSATVHVCSVIGAITIIFIKRNSCPLTHFWARWKREDILLLKDNHTRGVKDPRPWWHSTGWFLSPSGDLVVKLVRDIQSWPNI